MLYNEAVLLTTVKKNTRARGVNDKILFLESFIYQRFQQMHD